MKQTKTLRILTKIYSNRAHGDIVYTCHFCVCVFGIDILRPTLRKTPCARKAREPVVIRHRIVLSRRTKSMAWRFVYIISPRIWCGKNEKHYLGLRRPNIWRAHMLRHREKKLFLPFFFVLTVGLFMIFLQAYTDRLGCFI